MLQANDPPDLILLDVQLPGMDGFQICSEIQKIPALAAAPVIFLTARAELNDKLTGFSAGGADYLTKPFKMVELKARISALMRQTQRNRLLGRQEEQERQQEELDEAATVQRTLMTCNLGSVTGVEVVADCRPARTVGGDLYDIHPRGDGRLSIVEADVSGKGMPAAMVTASVRTVMRETTSAIASPGAALALTNRRLYDDLTEVSKLVTVFTAFYTPKQRALSYANAGHALPVYCPVGGAARVLEATGLPLGILDDTDYGEETLPFGPGDLLVVCSDGYAEAHNADNEIFGYDALLSCIAEVVDQPAQAIFTHITDTVAAFVQGREQSDDQTIIVLKGKE